MNDSNPQEHEPLVSTERAGLAYHAGDRVRIPVGVVANTEAILLHSGARLRDGKPESFWWIADALNPAGANTTIAECEIVSRIGREGAQTKPLTEGYASRTEGDRQVHLLWRAYDDSGLKSTEVQAAFREAFAAIKDLPLMRGMSDEYDAWLAALTAPQAPEGTAC